MASRTSERTHMYRAAMAVFTPVVKWWGRLEVSGLDALHESGPILLAGNHDSYWDPIAVGIAGQPRRQIRALAKSTLWKNAALGKVLDGMGQIPIDRGKGDVHALDRAVEELRGGRCIGVFPEGTRTRGRTLRARSGFGRLAERVPEAQVVSCTVEGTVDIGKFPRKRPRVKVHFFAPAQGGLRPGESAAEMSVRLLEEIRAKVPIPDYNGWRESEAERLEREAESARERGSRQEDGSQADAGGETTAAPAPETARSGDEAPAR
jgi:1-acyl-sn-glycerol-3-phosphate acyltransferase